MEWRTEENGWKGMKKDCTKLSNFRPGELCNSLVGCRYRYSSDLIGKKKVNTGKAV